MTDHLREELTSELGRLAVPRADLPDVVTGGRAALRRRRAATLFVAAAGIALAGVGIANLALDRSDDAGSRIVPAANDDPTPSSSDGWTTYHDPEERYTVRYPSDWHRAAEALQPHVEDPREILSVASYEPRPDDTRCAFGHALEDLGPTDAFVSVSESAGDLTSRFMITRPTAFAYDQGYQPTFSECLETPPAFEERFIPFRDGDRFFYAYVAVGEAASNETRDDALATLNSLSFEE
ncbi:MAG: hypothetical protein M3279_03885 [Actinomycetota bacterium]|nr:hypothetical protein [Actinomycetota bacterium]